MAVGGQGGPGGQQPPQKPRDDLSDPRWLQPAYRDRVAGVGFSWQEMQPLPGQRDFAEVQVNPKAWRHLNRTESRHLSLLGSGSLPKNAAPYGRETRPDGKPGLRLFGPAPYEQHVAPGAPSGVVVTNALRAQVPTFMYDMFGIDFSSTVLGMGGFGAVWKVVDRNSGQKLAAKVLEVTRFTVDMGMDISAAVTAMLREVKTLRDLSHPNVVAVDSVVHIKDPNTGFASAIVIILMELCDGNLDDLIACQTTEQFCHEWFAQVSGALQYLHVHDVAHMDLKMDNVLFKGTVQGVRVPRQSGMTAVSNRVYKLTDFGLSRFVPKKDRLGTNDVSWATIFQPPEIRDREIAEKLDRGLSVKLESRKVDVYQLGVCLALSLIGNRPHNYILRDLNAQVPGLDAIPWVRDSLVFSGLFDETHPVIELLKAMLSADPTQRCSMETVTLHPWILAQP